MWVILDFQGAWDCWEGKVRLKFPHFKLTFHCWNFSNSIQVTRNNMWVLIMANMGMFSGNSLVSPTQTHRWFWEACCMYAMTVVCKDKEGTAGREKNMSVITQMFHPCSLHLRFSLQNHPRFTKSPQLTPPFHPWDLWGNTKTPWSIEHPSVAQLSWWASRKLPKLQPWAWCGALPDTATSSPPWSCLGVHLRLEGIRFQIKGANGKTITLEVS